MWCSDLSIGLHERKANKQKQIGQQILFLLSAIYVCVNILDNPKYTINLFNSLYGRSLFACLDDAFYFIKVLNLIYVAYDWAMMNCIIN